MHMSIENKQADVSEQKEAQKQSDLNTQETSKANKDRAHELDNNKFIETKNQQHEQREKHEPKESDTRKNSLDELDSIRINESKKETSREENNQDDARKQDVEQITSVSDGNKKFEDYSMSELREMGDGKASHLNADFRERHEAESLGLSVGEYRDHLERIKEANKDESDESPNEYQQEKEEVVQTNHQDIIDEPERDKQKDEQFVSTDGNSTLDISKTNENERNIDLKDVETKSAENTTRTENNDSDLSLNRDSEISNINYEKNFDDINDSSFQDVEKQSNDIVHSLEVNDKVENVESKFDGNNFLKENSYDFHATNETRELVAKSVTPIREMGFDESIKAEVPSESYTNEERNKLTVEREKIDAPNESTVMQKVIGVDTGNIEKDLSEYLNPRDRKTDEPKDADVYGFVSKAEDSAPFTRTPQECYYNLRLDYDNTVYNSSEQSVYIIRFTDGTNYDIPYDKAFGGKKEREQPCTGNGFVGNKENLIPEYEVRPKNNKGAVVTDGAIYRIDPDGNEEKVAQFNKRDNSFKLIEVGEKNDS